MRDDRVFSFSAKPEDVVSLKEIEKLKQYAKDNHISFSSLVIKGLVKINRELGL